MAVGGDGERVLVLVVVRSSEIPSELAFIYHESGKMRRPSLVTRPFSELRSLI